MLSRSNSIYLTCHTCKEIISVVNNYKSKGLALNFRAERDLPQFLANHMGHSISITLGPNMDYFMRKDLSKAMKAYYEVYRKDVVKKERKNKLDTE